MVEIQHVEIDIHVPAGVSDERNNGKDVAADEVQNLMKKLDQVPGEPFKPRPVTISRVPAWFYEINKDLSEPKIVSIGPYHHGKESVRAMEEKKWSTLRDFLARQKDVRIEVYLREMRLLEAQARECYSETVSLESKDYVMMLLLDGCFILEFLLKLKKKDLLGIFSLNWAVNCLSSDLCLLENQIPFFVIHKLFEIQNGCACGQTFQDPCSLLNLIYEVMPWPAKALQFRQPKISSNQVQHLLHLYYKGVLPDNLEGEQRDMDTGKSCLPWFKIFSRSSSTISQKSIVDIESSSIVLIPCATELHEAGVKFRKKKSARDMFDISFQDGKMEMPNIQIDNILKNYLWNMVVFEQSQRFELGQILSSYVALMDGLINTEKDVAILERSNIISNFLKNDEQAATFFNHFSESFFGLDYSNHYFRRVFKNVKEYSESKLHKHRAKLMRDYFSSPWSIISVVAATILLILTVLQTYYSAK
ncbi:hypothetical protein LUZ61_014627 [Rhynchospora tenuis]|uniref:Uncharacterized protein n=1 Tax=Rhynchospora tenuis TaxID=198213 RepID=A0AAD5Z1X1_9POAL|nr:hypothetical protein LUZ61_014627 [Rhynchospora tenuis]